MGPENNNLLASLFSLAKGGEFRAHVRTVQLTQGQVLAEPLGPVREVYFPYAGVVSFSVPLTDGRRVQTGVVGRDGAVGALQAIDGKISPNLAAVQVAGPAAVIPAERVAEIANASQSIRSLFLRHEQFFLSEVQQSAACNAVHTVQQRVARWILRMNDLMGINVPLTQELLSEMIGVRRTSVSIAAAALQSSGLIKYRRGHIQIVDLEGLRRSSCECYETVSGHYERLVKKPS